MDGGKMRFDFGFQEELSFETVSLATEIPLGFSSLPCLVKFAQVNPKLH